MQPIMPILLTGSLNETDDDCACPDRAYVLAFDQSPSAIENDCACTDRASCLHHEPEDITPRYVRTLHTHVQSLPRGFKLLFSPYAPAGPSVLNEAAWRRWQHFDEPHTLDEAVDHRLAEQALVQPVSGQIRPEQTSAETLTVWLHITNACNLDCPYCYVRKSSARMREAVGLQSIEQVFLTAQKHDFERVKLKYAGGEASLHFRLIQRLHAAALDRAIETGISLREVVLSNGVRIRDEYADWLAENHVKLMISLDGIDEVHDRQRPMKGGGKSFDHVARTLDETLLPRGVRPDVTITITRLNAAAAADTVRWVLERDLPVSLNFYRQNTLSASRAELVLEEQTIIDGMLAAYGVFKELLPPRPFFNGLLDRVQAEAHAHTCGVQHSYLVITHEGELAQCQMHLGDPVRNSLHGDLLSLVAAGPIQNLSVDVKEGCRSCEFRYRCTGGCPLETFRATGRWDVKSPHCRIYKTLLPAALRLEGLRLLKVNNLLH